ncbi:MAG: glycerol-3-phosphate acyltransferase [Candidatus Neomarinimicrobiota bacterium]
MNIILAIIIGYLLGNFNAPYILGKIFKGIDIRERGTSNAGAANAVIVMGWKLGAASFLIDALKATGAMWIVKYLTGGNTDLSILAGAMAVVGHIYPVFMKFKGGKGIASILGMMLGLNGFIAIILYLTIVLGAVISNNLVIGEFLILILFPVAVYLFGYSNVAVALIVFVSLLSTYKLSDNLIRTFKGTEQKLSSVLFKKK